MTQMIPRTQLHTQPVSPPSTRQLSINELINFDPILSDYFKSHSASDNYWKLANQLMLDGLRYRTSLNTNQKVCCCNYNTPIPNNNYQPFINQAKISQPIQQRQVRKNVQSPSPQKNKHYNVAYVKHNRFLSPKQKKQNVTPKVTEIIPTRCTPTVIYGKPRVKVDNEYGCPYHTNEEQCLRSIPYGGPCQLKTPQQLKNTLYQIHIREKDIPMSKPSVTNQLSRYKSSPNLNDLNQDQTKDFNKTKKNMKIGPISKRQMSQQTNKMQKIKKGQEEQGTHTVYVDRIVQIASKAPGKLRIVKSPKQKLQNNSQNQQQQQQNEDSYLKSKTNLKDSKKNNNGNHMVESKIKFLVDRDKKNKAMEKNMKKQQQRIKQLQEIVMKPDKKMTNDGNTKKITASDIISIASSNKSSSEMSMMDSKVVQKYKNNMNKKSQNKKVGVHFGEIQKIQQPSPYQQKNKYQYDYNGQHSDEDQSFDQICSCSKTFSEDSVDGGSIDPLGESSVSDFQA